MFVFGIFLASLTVANPAPAKNLAVEAMKASLQKQRESLQAQRDSFRRQAGMKPNIAIPLTEFITPIPPLVQADCPALRTDDVERLIASAAEKQSLEPTLIRAVIRQESGFRPCAVSIKGAQGLMQLMPATARQLRVSDPFDPTQNVEGGAALLKQLLDKYNGDLRSTLAAYNAGANRVDEPGGQSLPAETQRYIAKIFAELGINTADPVSAEPEFQ